MPYQGHSLQNYYLDKQIFVVHDPKLGDAGSSCSSGTTTDSGDAWEAADTTAEDSTDEDPELRPADYWECVKCKNKQNNPLYRYCEKCYQVRDGWMRM